jgi:hypothetical protein
MAEEAKSAVSSLDPPFMAAALSGAIGTHLYAGATVFVPGVALPFLLVATVAASVLLTPASAGRPLTKIIVLAPAVGMGGAWAATAIPLGDMVSTMLKGFAATATAAPQQRADVLRAVAREAEQAQASIEISWGVGFGVALAISLVAAVVLARRGALASGRQVTLAAFLALAGTAAAAVAADHASVAPSVQDGKASWERGRIYYGR